jgi:hypothetical protein
VNLTDRIARTDAQRNLPDNVVPFERRERRAPAKWWEKAQAGQLVTKDYTGKGPDAA